jgi:putative CocE/NonD family hydrolase
VLFVLFGGLSLVPAVAGASGNAKASASEVIQEHKLMISMRDGVRLATNIFRPDSPRRYTAVLLRTPYGRHEMQSAAETLARQGFVGVWQDVRGRFDSEGEWHPFVNESKDGYDTIEWIVAQPWSNGDVVMFGGSYVGMAQWLAAKEHNPHLKGLITIVTPGDFYEDFFFEGGAFLQSAAAMWATFVDGRGINIDVMSGSAWPGVFTHVPVIDSLQQLNRNPQYFRDWINHPRCDAFWRRLSWDSEFEKFDFPVLHIGGWYDIFQNGTIENFHRMTARAKESARSKQHLLVGPWAHQGQESSKVGEVDFGEQARLSLAIVLTFLDKYFRDGSASAANLPAVRVFTMGENRWNNYDSWPPSGTTFVDYYFHSEGRANTAEGNGLLTTRKAAGSEAPDKYTYDPANPVPTRGGGNCCWPEVVAWGPFDQREVEKRSDVLVYTTDPLAKDLRVNGPVQIKLWAASTATDTDFTGKLVDVDPKGLPLNLTDGIQRAAYRKSCESFQPLKPGTPAEITIDLWNTSHVFKKGHRIRVEISSSNFPRYSRNLNTGRQPETGSEMKKAQQTIFHDRRRPSRIVLPMLAP